MIFFKYIADPIDRPNYQDYNTDLDGWRQGYSYGGEVLNGIEDATWIERYAEPGEFKFIAPAGSGLRENLPINTYISHTNTYEVMRVENHEIQQDEDGNSTIIISGRSMETLMEWRNVGGNQLQPYPIVDPINQASPIDGYPSWVQANILFWETMHTPQIDGGNYIHGIDSSFSVTEWDTLVSHPEHPREVKIDSLYNAIRDLLRIDDIGIKVVRPCPGRAVFPSYFDHGDTYFVFHDGVYRADTVIFSDSAGDLSTAEYFWSDKNYKNYIQVFCKWITFMVGEYDEYTHFQASRRFGFLEAFDIGEEFTEADPPELGDYAAMYDEAEARALVELAKYRPVSIVRAEITPNNTHFKFRTDYNIGDIVTIEGAHATSSRARVLEYVEIENSEGHIEYPTLALLRTPIPNP